MFYRYGTIKMYSAIFFRKGEITDAVFKIPTVKCQTVAVISITVTEKKSLDLKSAAALLPKRPPFSNKGTFGKVLLVTGSKKAVGCCTLASLGALRSGAGLVTVAFPDCIYNSLTTRLTETLFLPLLTDNEGFMHADNIDTLVSAAQKSDVVMFGCGVGTADGVKELLKAIITQTDKPLIIDADGLNCLCSFKDVLQTQKRQILLTPHPGEMARLCECTIAEVEENREKTVIDFCRKYKVNVLLKGHETLVCSADTEKLYVNRTGNTGLSKGGSGDLLSGIIAGLAAQNPTELFSSAVLGAFIHGLTADLLKEKYTEYAMLPSDCADALPSAFALILNIE